MPIPMKAALKYVGDKNSMRRIFKEPELQLIRDRKRIIQMLEGDMSPENLTCDGELRGRALNERVRFLNQVAADLKQLAKVS